MAIKLDDIINSTINDKQIEINSKDVNLQELKQNELDASIKKSSQKPTVITVKKTIVNADGSKTEFETKFDINFQTPEEQREYLDALGYSGSKPNPSVTVKPAPGQLGKTIGRSFLTGISHVVEYISRNRESYERAEQKNVRSFREK